MNIIVGGTNNLYSAAFNASAKTLTISGVNNFPLDVHSLISIYDTTVSLPFVFTANTFSWSYVAGKPVYVYGFSKVPAGAANGDALVVVLDIPQNQSVYSELQYQASKI